MTVDATMADMRIAADAATVMYAVLSGSTMTHSKPPVQADATIVTASSGVISSPLGAANA